MDDKIQTIRTSTWTTHSLKLLMAVSGLMMVGFLVLHLAGNLLVFKGAEAMSHYAKGLRDLGPLLWVARLGLIGAVLAHIYSAVILTRSSRLARPVAYNKNNSTAATLASRTMALSGSLIFSFILFHLCHLTFRLTHAQEFSQLGEFDVYPMLILSFKSPILSGFYFLSVSLLGMHLYHGVVSVFQTLGLGHEGWNCWYKKISAVLSLGLVLGFASIPVSIFFGFIH